jgi:hypothetical protein
LLCQHDVVQFGPDTLRILLKELTKRLIFSCAAARYTNALDGIVRQSGYALFEQPTLLHEIVEQVKFLSYQINCSFSTKKPD